MHLVGKFSRNIKCALSKISLLTKQIIFLFYNYHLKGPRRLVFNNTLDIEKNFDYQNQIKNREIFFSFN